MMDPDQELAEQRIGTKLGGWRLERVLGVGGMATVFLARRDDGWPAAVKVLHPYLLEHHELRKRFLREGPIGSALAAVGPLCEGLPQVYESGTAEDGSVFMVMEVLDGETVFDRLCTIGMFPWGQALWIGQKVLDVLVLAHAHGIIHRDIKPENLHLGADGRLRVLDFGIARVTEGLPDGMTALPEKTRTQTGTAMGSCHYMAPEQAMGDIKQIDARTDIFGLGATLFHLMSGCCVHGDLVEGSLLVAAATQPAPPLASVAPAIPQAVCAVVDRSIRFQKKERYPDAATMKADIAAIGAGKAPPYVSAIAAGQIAPGAPLQRGR